MKRRFLFLFALLLASFGILSAAETVRDSGTHFMRDAIMPFIESGECPGAIAILYNNGVQETTCLGWANAEKKIPMSPDCIFMQCSQTKGFCGMLVAILIEEGKLNLDDPVADYLPEFKVLKVKAKDENDREVVVPAKNTLTLRMCMNHTAGFNFEIPSKSKRGWSAVSVRDAAREAAAIPLNFEPGTQAKYSNTGIDVGAAIVEVVTGKPWEVFLKERVLDPLEMTDTTFWPSDEKLAAGIALYDVKPGEKAKFRAFHPAMPFPHNGSTVFSSAGAGLWTTARDQLKFYKMLMNLGIGDNGVRILKEETAKKYIASSTRLAAPGGYSLGLYASADGWVGHGGAWQSCCMVNWQSKKLWLWVVQLNGNGSRISQARDRAKDRFFEETLGTAGQEYSGRME